MEFFNITGSRRKHLLLILGVLYWITTICYEVEIALGMSFGFGFSGFAVYNIVKISSPHER